MQLNEEKLYRLLDRIQSDLIKANRTNQLKAFFSEFSENKYLELPRDRLSYTDRSMILVIGASKLTEDEIRKTAKENNIDPRRIECNLDYSKMKSFNFQKLENNTNYRCIIVGPIPHSVPGKGDYESIISKMEQEYDKYPQVFIVKTKSDQLRITKSGLEEIFRKLS